jgi:spermidine dehydrogenase
MGTATVNYAMLDQSSANARIRLNSTVINVRHDGDPSSAKEVIVNYTTGGRLREVRARAYNVKGPIVYTNVFLKNWKAFERLGVSEIFCPTMYHDSVALAEAADLGDLHHPRNSSEPIAVRMTRMPGAIGLPRKDQHRIGRADLLATSFETFERNIRGQLNRILGPGDFDAARDIIGIANSDAAASPHTDAAFLEAHRAVSELTNERGFPFVRENVKPG